MRYVERNPVRAKTIPVRKAQNWKWSSVGTPPADAICPRLHKGPVKRREDWLDWVNQPLTIEERKAMQRCIARGCPFGEEQEGYALDRQLIEATCREWVCRAGPSRLRKRRR